MGWFFQASCAIHQHWPWFWPLVAALFGGVLGSFITCAAYRLPRGISLRHPPSSCNQCRTVLGVADLIPVFSWLALRGRCRHCGTPIGAASLWVEAACAAGAALAALFLITC